MPVPGIRSAYPFAQTSKQRPSPMSRAGYGSRHVATADKKGGGRYLIAPLPYNCTWPYNSPPYNSQTITDYTAATADYSM